MVAATKKNENPIHMCCSKLLQIRKWNAQATKYAKSANPTMGGVNNA